MARGHRTTGRSLLGRSRRLRRQIAIPATAPGTGSAPGIGAHLTPWSRGTESLIRGYLHRDVLMDPAGWATLAQHVKDVVGEPADEVRSRPFIDTRIATGALLSELSRHPGGIDRHALCEDVAEGLSNAGALSAGAWAGRAFGQLDLQAHLAALSKMPQPLLREGGLIRPGPALDRWVRYGFPRDW